MVRLNGRLEAELAHRGLGERDALEAVVVVAIDRLPLHPLHLSVDRIGDDLVVAAQALLVRLELDVAARRAKIYYYGKCICTYRTCGRISKCSAVCFHCCL